MNALSSRGRIFYVEDSITPIVDVFLRCRFFKGKPSRLPVIVSGLDQGLVLAESFLIALELELEGVLVSNPMRQRMYFEFCPRSFHPEGPPTSQLGAKIGPCDVEVGLSSVSEIDVQGLAHIGAWNRGGATSLHVDVEVVVIGRERFPD